MNAPAKIVQSDATDIALVVTENPGIVLLDSEKFDAFYERMKAETDKLVPTVDTAKGRDEIRSLAARVRSSKAAIDKARLGLTKEWRENVDRANSAGKIIAERLEGLAVDVRRPLTEWEEAEKTRVATIDGMLAEIKAHARVDVLDTAAMVRERGAQIWKLEFAPDVYQDRLTEVEQAKADAVTALKAALDRLTREEADRAELERLRAEAAERARAEAERAAEEERRAREAEEERLAEQLRLDAEREEAERTARLEREAEDRARREAEQAAEAERQRVAQEHADALAAERRRAEDAERVAQAERDRIAVEEAARIAEAERVAAEQRKRDEDQAHRTAVKTAAKQALMTCGADEDTARKIVVAILAGEIPNVSLRF